MAGPPCLGRGVPTIEEILISATRDRQDKTTVVKYGAGGEKGLRCNASACSMIHQVMF